MRFANSAAAIAAIVPSNSNISVRRRSDSAASHSVRRALSLLHRRSRARCGGSRPSTRDHGRFRVRAMAESSPRLRRTSTVVSMNARLAPASAVNVSRRACCVAFSRVSCRMRRERRIEEGSPADERREVYRTPGEEEPALAGLGIREVRKEGRRFRADLVCVCVQRDCRSLSLSGGAKDQRKHDDERGRPPTIAALPAREPDETGCPSRARRTRGLASRAVGRGKRGHTCGHLRAGTRRNQELGCVAPCLAKAYPACRSPPPSRRQPISAARAYKSSPSRRLHAVRIATSGATPASTRYERVPGRTSEG